MTSRTWDRMTHEAQQRQLPICLFDLGGRLLGRTADPRINPRAVRSTSSSTTHRRRFDGGRPIDRGEP